MGFYATSLLLTKRTRGTIYLNLWCEGLARERGGWQCSTTMWWTNWTAVNIKHSELWVSDLFNGHNYSHLLMGSSGEYCQLQSFTNRLARLDVQLKVTRIYNLFRVPPITRLTFTYDTVGFVISNCPSTNAGKWDTEFNVHPRDFGTIQQCRKHQGDIL